jgi:hypothetical protein
VPEPIVLEPTPAAQSTTTSGTAVGPAGAGVPDDPSEAIPFAGPPNPEDLEDTQELPIVRADPPPPVAAGPDIVG